MYTDFYTEKRNNIPEPVGSHAAIRYMVVDVDGTLTDSSIYYDEHGNELKKFSTKDGVGFFAAKACGIKILVLTGRKCKATIRRMQELKVDYVEQEIVNKPKFLRQFMERHSIRKEEIAYLGDDLNDYEGMMLTGFVGCPLDSSEEILAIADYVSKKKGGYGAVRDIIEYLLKNRGQWTSAIRQCYQVSGI